MAGLVKLDITKVIRKYACEMSWLMLTFPGL